MIKLKMWCKWDLGKWKDLLFRDQILVAGRPDNPSNIMWENLGISWKNRILRMIFIYTTAFALLLATFFSILWAKSGITDSYPVVNCKQAEHDL